MNGAGLAITLVVLFAGSVGLVWLARNGGRR